MGKTLLRSELDDGLELKKITSPFGVIAAIVEARPDAVTQLCALALKSGNALMIKAGAEIRRTTSAILAAFVKALESTAIPANVFTNVEGREATHELLALQDYVDLVVPRGSAELVRFVFANTRIPVIGHAEGVCHIYVESSANQEMAISLILDAKTQAPATCNAVETVLVDQAIAGEFLPTLFERLRSAGVKVRGCAATRRCRRKVAQACRLRQCRRVSGLRWNPSCNANPEGWRHHRKPEACATSGEQRLPPCDAYERSYNPRVLDIKLIREKPDFVRQAVFCAAWIQREWSTMFPPDSPTDIAMASVPKWESRPASFMPADLWAWKGWLRTNMCYQEVDSA